MSGLRHSSILHYLKWLLMLNIAVFVSALLYKYWTSGSIVNKNVEQLVRTYYQQPCQCDPIREPPAAAEPGPAVQEPPPEPVDEFKIPNIVHYIWYNKKTEAIKYHHLLSMLSAHKVLKPEVIMFHTDREPTGEYWEQAKQIPSLKVVQREPPRTLFGEAVKEPMFYTSHSNVDRVKILQEYGGIYLDLDVFVIRSFDDLRRKHKCVIGQEQKNKACGSVIMCAPDSVFLILWLNSYLDDYQMEVWAYNTGKVPFNLARRYPDLVYMEPTRINQPNFNDLDKIWSSTKSFDWKNNYTVHILYRLWKTKSPYYQGIEPDPETIKTMNSTFGQIARSIYYGSSEMLT